jgi:hypothetical protein
MSDVESAISKHRIDEGKKRGRGKPSFTPSPEQRNIVAVMAAIGLPHEKIRMLIHQPDDRPGG